jgi:hypothetical protein
MTSTLYREFKYHYTEWYLEIMMQERMPSRHLFADWASVCRIKKMNINYLISGHPAR